MMANLFTFYFFYSIKRYENVEETPGGKELREFQFRFFKYRV